MVQLAKGRVREVLGNSADGFALTVAAQLSDSVVWLGLGRDLGTVAPSGCEHFVYPARIAFQQRRYTKPRTLGGEQALRTPGISCVVIETEHGLDLTESRRLQPAAEESGALGLTMFRRLLTI